MQKVAATSLSGGVQVVDRLVRDFDADKILQVEQRSEHIYQAQLKDGTYAAVIVDTDGSLIVLELPEVCG